MHELNTNETNEVSGAGPAVIAAGVVVVAVVALVAIGFVDGWKEEASKSEQNKKKSK